MEYNREEKRVTEDTIDLLNQLMERIDQRNREREDFNAICAPVSRDNRLVISFVGRFKTGKSSLLNAVIGSDYLPTKATTATAVVTRIIKGAKPRASLIENGSKKGISFQQAKDIILNYKTDNVENCAEILFELPLPWLSYEVEIRDTPGMDDSAQDGILEQVTMRTLRDTDVCVMVYDAHNLLSQSERDKTVRIQKIMGGNVVFAVNRINLLSSQNDYFLVKKQADNYFKQFQSPFSEMSKIFMICSAPGNLVLDGFDAWFKNLAEDSNFKRKNEYRNTALAGKRKAQDKIAAEQIQTDTRRLKNQKELVEKMHFEYVDAVRREQTKKIKQQREAFSQNIVPQARAILCDTSGLQTLIKKAKTDSVANANSDYAKLTAKATKQYFKDRFKKVCDTWQEHFHYQDNPFVGNAIGKLSFPGKHTKSVPATRGETLGGAGVGAGLGFLFGGPIGAGIGAALGGVIGAANTTEDDSVDYTMQFIKNTVVPAVRGAFDSYARDIEKAFAADSEPIESDYSPFLHTIDNVQKILDEELTAFIE